jgi:hypothetical protein
VFSCKNINKFSLSPCFENHLRNETKISCWLANHSSVVPAGKPQVYVGNSYQKHRKCRIFKFSYNFLKLKLFHISVRMIVVSIVLLSNVSLFVILNIFIFWEEQHWNDLTTILNAFHIQTCFNLNL